MELQLTADEIVEAALAILREDGLDAVSMRSVATRLGVSPVPLYSRVGNKDALLDAMADHLLVDLAPPAGPDEPWPDYARRWAAALRRRLDEATDARLVLGARRSAYVEASAELIASMRAGGLSPDAAVQACRLLTWATVGFVAVERAATTPARAPTHRQLPGSDPEGVTPEEAAELFDLHVRYLVDGIRNHAQPIGS